MRRFILSERGLRLGLVAATELGAIDARAWNLEVRAFPNALLVRIAVLVDTRRQSDEASIHWGDTHGSRSIADLGARMRAI